MSYVTAAKRPSPWGGDVLTLLVDGQSLDELLDVAAPGRGMLELCPAFHVAPGTGELAIVRKRLLPAKQTVSNAPLLICPDDLDFSCAVVIVEVRLDGPFVTWSRFGLDESPPSNDPSFIGSRVDWFEEAPSYIFERASYWRALSCCFAAME